MIFNFSHFCTIQYKFYFWGIYLVWRSAHHSLHFRSHRVPSPEHQAPHYRQEHCQLHHPHPIPLHQMDSDLFFHFHFCKKKKNYNKNSKIEWSDRWWAHCCHLPARHLRRNCGRLTTRWHFTLCIAVWLGWIHIWGISGCTGILHAQIHGSTIGTSFVTRWRWIILHFPAKCNGEATKRKKQRLDDKE